MIAAFLESHDDKVKLKDIAIGALSLSREKIGRADQNRIKAALRRLGWKEGPSQKGYVLWVRGPGAAPKAATGEVAGASAERVATSERDPDPLPGDHTDDPM